MALSQFKQLFRGNKAVIFLVGIFFLYGSSVVSADGVSEGKVVSLSHNSNSGDLFAAYSHALYRRDAKTHQWQAISLPPSVEQLTAVVAVPAKGSGTIYLASPGIGVLHSDDGGKSWDTRNEGLPSKKVTHLIRHANQPDTLYAVIPEAGIFRSENAGEDWLLMDGGPDDMADIIIHSDMPDSMQTGWIFAATKVGVSRSMDCFCLWREAGSLTGEVTGLTYDPKQPAHIYAATHKGVFRSEDGGEHWESVGAPLIGVTALLFTTSGDLYVGTQAGELFKGGALAKKWKQLDGF